LKEKKLVENFTKEELDEELDFYAIDLFAGGRSIGFNSMKRQLPKAMELMNEILFKPTFSNQEELDKLVKQSVTGLEAASKNPDAIMGRVSNALLYGTDHPWGEYATAETYQNVKLADLKNHYDTYFRPNIGYLTIVGDVSLEEAKALAMDNFSDWEAADIPKFDYPVPTNVASTEIAIVDLPTSTQSNLYVSNLQNLKKENGDYFASIIGNHMLGGSSFAKLFLNLREDKGYTYGSYSQMGNDIEMPSVFSAYGKFRNEVTDSSLMEIMNELHAITSTPLTVEDIKTAVSERTGRFALGLERPQTVASYARTILLEGLDDDFYANYLKELNNQSPTSVLAAMNNYIKPDQARVIIVGKAEEIAPGLQAMNIPIKYYDIWGDEVADPTIKADTGDVTMDDVLDKFFTAIGGKDKAMAITSSVQTFEMPIPGLPAPAIGEMKTKASKSSTEIEAPGFGSLMKIKFNGETGFTESQGQKTEMDENQILGMKILNPFMPELTFNETNTVLDNIVDLDGRKAYKLIYSAPGDLSAEYFYDLETGLRIKNNVEVETGGQKIVQTINFSDYKDVDGLLMPHKMTTNAAGMDIPMNLKSIKLNVDIPDSDFE